MSTALVLGLALGCTGRTAPDTTGDDTEAVIDDSAAGWADSGPLGPAPDLASAEAELPEDHGPAPSGIFTYTGTKPRNVLMLSIDTLQVARMGRYGGERDTTPFLDRILDQGVALDDHHSCSNWTLPGVLCALGGNYGFEMGYVPVKERGPPDEAPEQLKLASDFFQERGYATGLVSANPFLAPAWYVTAGYDEVTNIDGLAAPAIIASGLETLEVLEADGQPWFLHLHFLDPHLPYAPPPEYLDELHALPEVAIDLSDMDDINILEAAWDDMDQDEQDDYREVLRARYDAGLRFLDDELGELVDTLDERGSLEDTIVVVWSDHGEQLYEDDKLGHGWELVGLETRGLAGFWSPTMGSVDWTEPTGNRDVLPTLFDALGWTPEPSFSGRAVGQGADLQLYSEAYKSLFTLQSVTEGSLKLTYTWNGDLVLHDVRADPAETVDLLPERQGEAALMWEWLRPYVEAVAALELEDVEPVPPEL